MKAIRCNPTWEWAGGVLLEVVKHGSTVQVQKDAEHEILKAMKILDELLAKHTDYFEPKEAENGS